MLLNKALSLEFTPNLCSLHLHEFLELIRHPFPPFPPPPPQIKSQSSHGLKNIGHHSFFFGYKRSVCLTCQVRPACYAVLHSSVTWLRRPPFPVGSLLTRAKSCLGTTRLRRGQTLLAVCATSSHRPSLSWAAGLCAVRHAPAHGRGETKGWGTGSACRVQDGDIFGVLPLIL